MADDEPDEIQSYKLPGAKKLLQRKGEEEKCDHVEEQVRWIGVYETAHDHRVVLLFTQEEIRPEQEFVDDVRNPEHAKQADDDRQDQDCWRSVVSGVEHEVSFIGRAGYLYTVSLIQNPTT